MKFHLGIDSDGGKDVVPIAYEAPGHYNNLAIFDGAEYVVGNDEYDVFHKGLKREFYIKLLLMAPEMLELLKFFCKEVKDEKDLTDMDKLMESCELYYHKVKEGIQLIQKIEEKK